MKTTLIHDMEVEIERLQKINVVLLDAVKEAVNGLNQLTNKEFSGRFRNTYALCSHLDKVIKRTVEIDPIDDPAYQQKARQWENSVEESLDRDQPHDREEAGTMGSYNET